MKVELNEIIKYAQGMNVQPDVLEWVNKHLKAHIEKKNPEQTEIEHIIDYLASDKRPKRISKMSYAQAKANTKKWNDALIKKGNDIQELPEDTKVIKDFGDGFKIVRLVGENAYKREGFLMRHCVAGYYGRDVEIYSLRDKDNMPHCTMEKNQQIKGKGNGSIHPKYIKYVVAFLEEVGMRVGDNEMKNLGYINIEKIKSKLHPEKNNFFNQKYLYEQDTFYGVDGAEYCELDLWDYRPLIKIKGELDLEINFNLADFLSKAIRKILSVKVEDSSSGDCARIGSSGDCARIGSSGYYARIGSSGYNAQIGSSGDCARIDITGKKSIGAAAGYNSIAKASVDGCIALTWWDKKNERPRISVGYVGENIKADTWYKVNENGEFVEVV